MDIFEYIDRVKANYSKQPEPRYNTKKYFIGTDNVDDIGPGPSNRGKLPRLNVMPENYNSEGRGTGVMIDPRGLQDGKIPLPTQELNDGGRVGFDKGGDVENLKKLLKSKDPKFFEKFKKIQNKHFNGNFKTTAESIGNMEAIKAKFNRAGIEQGGQGTKLKNIIEPKGETLRQTDFTTKLNKNPDMLKKYFKSKEYLTINNLANKVGINISKRKDRDYLTKTLLDLGIENKPLTSNIKEYSLSDFAKKINYKTKIRGEQKSQSVRNKNISKVDPELNALEKKIINNVARSSKQEGVFIARAVEDAGHAVSVNVANKYPNLIKDSNILDIQSRVYQDPKVNMDILNKKGFDSRFDSVFKELNLLVNKPVTQKTRQQLINLKNKMSSIRDESIEAIKKETKKFPYLKGQEKRIPKLSIKIPSVGQKFESKNLFADMSVVDQQYRVGNINKVNPRAKKLIDLNPQELKKYTENMFAQNSDNVQKFYTAVKDKKTGQAAFSKLDIADVGETIEAVENLPKNKQIKICNALSNGGLPGDCANAIKKDPIKTSQIIVEETKDLKTAAGARALKAGRTLLKFGVVGEGAVIGLDAGIRGYMGRPKNEAFLAATFREGKADDLRKKRAGLTDREFLVDKATDLRNKISLLQQQIITSEAEGTDTGTLEKILKETMAEIEKPFDKTGTRLVDLLDPGSATNISYQRKMENIMDSDRAKSMLAKQTKDDVDMGIPNISDEIEVDAGVSKKSFAPTKTFGSFRNKMLMREPDIRAGINDLYKKGTFGEPGLELTKEKAIKGYKAYLKFYKDQQNAPLSELAEQFGAEQVYGTQGKFASGGMARASFGIGGFTKAQFIIQRMKNSLKQAFGKTDADSKYVNQTFPNMIKELEAKPELGNNENVFKAFSEDLPKDQRIVVHSDDSIDFFTQTEFGPQNIKRAMKFAEENNISVKEASRILKMEPEDQVLEKTRLQILKDKDRTRQASGGLTSLTRTIPPERGPNSQGLASFMKNGKR